MIAALTGLLAGAVHALAGPDHLAAIAPLAAGGRMRPWLTGLLWGLGHTLGLALVGLITLAAKGLLPVEVISSFSDRLVGVALVLVGLWGLRRAFSHRLHAHEHMHEGVQHSHVHLHDSEVEHGLSRSHLHTHGPIAIGALHGFAGSAGLFAVLPALALPSLQASLLYLGGFVAGSLAAMSAYSWMLGTIATRFRLLSLRPYRYFLSGSSVIAIVLGCVWLVG